jgi:acyl-CoA reductase-like NAD-dependent aldehyde dehydrogenase
MQLAHNLHAPFAELERAFARQRELSRAEPPASLSVRRDRLKRLLSALEENADALVAAMSADFGHRATHESETYDINGAVGAIRHDLNHTAHWMRRRRYPVRGYMWPGRAAVLPTPLGVIGVMSPWNFPVYLALSPLSAALSAGNRALLKPSEHTPRTSELMAEMIGRKFGPEEIAVCLGGADVAERFASLPFDHLLFTGSTAVGRKIAAAAAQNLTPVTLELGGKSPLLVTPSADPNDAAARCMFGKLANAGQICVSPDYALVPRARLDEFVEHAKVHAQRLYPSFADNPDYSAVAGAQRLARLEAMIAEAELKGARVARLGASGAGKLAPTLVVEPASDTRLMQEEIFGPVLPVVPYDSLPDAISFINARPRPLALYLFVRDREEQASVLARTVSGGVTVNDVIYHVGCNTLPFGGVGASGMGAYHGEAGFCTFSHMKPVFFQTRLNGRALFETPRTPFRQAFGRFFRRIV